MQTVLAAGQNDLVNACREIFLCGSLLRQIADLIVLQSVSGGDRAAGRRFQMQKPFDQRTFSGAVFTDDAQIIAAVDGKGHVGQDGSAFIGERYVVTGK